MKKQWILWIVSLVFVVFVFQRIAEVGSIGVILSQGKWQWVVLAFILQFIYYIIYARLYQKNFDIIGIKTSWRHLFPIVLSSLVVNVITPTAGLAGIALFVNDARQRGHSAGRAAVAIILTWVTNYSVLTLIVLIGFAYLHLIGELKRYEMVGAFVMSALILFLAGFFVLAAKNSRLLHKFLLWLSNFANFIASFIRIKQPFDSDWAERSTDEFVSAVKNVSKKRKDLVEILGIALLLHLIQATILLCTFLAFYHFISVEMVIVGYSIIALFRVISPTPEGIGVVEGVSALFFRSLGISGSMSAIIVLMFRGITFWFPLIMGFLFLRRVIRENKKPAD